MAKKQTTQKTAAKYIVTITLAVLFVAAISLGVLLLIRHIQLEQNAQQDNASDKNTASEILQNEEDLKDEEKVAESSNDAKDRMEADERTKTTVEKDASGMNIAKPELGFVAEEDGKIVAGGSIPNINETAGKCTFVFTKGDANVSVTTGILPNPSYISCETARIDKSKFTSGIWNVKIQYKSNTSEGESESQTYTIQ